MTTSFSAGQTQHNVSAPIGVKICGIRDQIALQTACEAGAEWIGLVFFTRSPRYISPKNAASLLNQYKGALPKIVGLFVKASDETIADTLAHCHLDILQIYDTPDRARDIRQRFGQPVWLSCPVTTPDDLPDESGVDGLVIEPRAPASATHPGGNGIPLDWSILKNWSSPKQWMLAGGLTPDNVAQAIRESGAHAVDVSSGVETKPGIKSSMLIRSFIENTRSPL